MRKVNQGLSGFAWFILVLVFLSGMIAAAFFLTGYLYNRLNWQPPLLVTQIVNTLLGLLLAGALVGMGSKLARSMG